MKRILITRPLPDRVIEEARAHFEIELRDDPTPMKVGQMRAALTLYDGVLPTLGDMFNAEVFDGFDDPRCKILANFGVGYNHIDVVAATQAGVCVTNTPGAVTDATSDIAMTLMLMTARRAGEGERLLRAGEWTGWTPTQLLGLHMTGKTVGIIGMGRIGQAIAKRCFHGFDMKVLYTKRSGDVDMGFPAERCDLDEMLGRSDFAVLCVPSSAQTHHIVGEKELNLMSKQAFLINIARGDVVDEAALIKALCDGQIAGAGLDVYEREPDVPDALKEMENVTLLPHLGTAALEVREDMGMMAVDNLKAFFGGHAPPNTVG